MPAKFPRPLERKTTLTTHEEEIFQKVFDEILHNVQRNDHFKDIPDISEWVQKLLSHNLPHGKQIRGRCVVSSVRVLKHDTLTDHDLKLASAMGWIIEMFHVCFLVTEDIMKKSETRRRHSCLHLTGVTRKSAINDAFIISGLLYHILDCYFKSEPYYKYLVRLFKNIFLRTSFGQCDDFRHSQEICSNFSMKIYSKIVKFRTSYYTFCLPVKAALLMVGATNGKNMTMMDDILLEIGHLYQVQDDYLDFYGSSKMFGNNDSDIQENKYSWLVVRAIELSNDLQESTIRENYGKGRDSTPENLQAMKSVYAELNLTMEFLILETTSYLQILAKIHSLPKDFPSEILMTLLDLIYGRKY